MTTTTDNSMTITHRLVGWGTFAELEGSIRAHLFGHLANLAIPFIRAYTSDFYHDVRWINEWVTGPTTFYYGVRESGTQIGTDRSLCVQHNDYAYEVRLWADAGRWTDGRYTWMLDVTLIHHPEWNGNTYKVHVEALVEASTEHEAQQVTGMMLAGRDQRGRVIPLSGPDSWAPDVKTITQVHRAFGVGDYAPVITEQRD